VFGHGAIYTRDRADARGTIGEQIFFDPGG
jgi:hypothetical protein